VRCDLDKPGPAPDEILVRVEACGVCRWCRDGRKNLCPDSGYTVGDADGGFAGYTTVPEAYAHPLPPSAAGSRVATPG